MKGLVGAVLLCVVVLLAGADYGPGRGTPEDTVILQFGGSPAGIPHIGYVAPHPGRLLYLYTTGHSPGQGAGNTTLSVVRQDGGVMCSVTVPCTLGDGVHVPADGGVVECEADVSRREVIEFEPTEDCALPPTVFMQAAFHYL